MTKQCKTVNNVRYCWEKPESQKDPLLRNLTKIATKASRLFTDLPVTVEVTSTELSHRIIGNKLESTHAMPFQHAVYPNDKRYKKLVIGHGIYLDETFYNKFKKNPYKLQQTVLHELAHIAVDKDRIKHPQGHTPHFRKVARELGCDKDYISAIDDEIQYTRKEQEEILRRMKKQSG